jgi:hypothetical protein
MGLVLLAAACGGGDQSGEAERGSSDPTPVAVEQVAASPIFWFAWAAFQPDTRIIPPPDGDEQAQPPPRVASGAGVIHGSLAA